MVRKLARAAPWGTKEIMDDPDQAEDDFVRIPPESRSERRAGDTWADRVGFDESLVWRLHECREPSRNDFLAASEWTS
jgi:hypothetical protein